MVDTLQIFQSCDTIGWRWVAQSGTGNNADPVRGIDVFQVDVDTLKISEINAELNSGAFLSNLGNPQCQAPSRTKRMTYPMPFVV